MLPATDRPAAERWPARHGPVRIGFLGAGHIATFHSKMLRASGADVVWAGVHDVDAARSEAFARASGATACRTEDEVLDGADAVYVCTWTSEHPRLVAAAAERGLPLFCEKPLATNLADARTMAETVRAAGITNQVGLVLRRSPAFLALRDLVHDPAAGDLLTVVFRDDQWMPVPGAYGSTWRGDVAKAGGGTLLEHSIHDLDLLEATLAPIVAVAARSGNRHGMAGIEDLMVVTLDFVGGATGTLTSIWHDIEPRGSLRRVEVFCERRWVSLEHDRTGPVCWSDADGGGGVLGEEALGFGENPDGAFVEAARAQGRAWPDFDVGVRAHEVADAIYRSAAAGGERVTV